MIKAKTIVSNLESVLLWDTFACDTETTGLNAWKFDRPFAISFCNEKGETAYIEWAVDPFTREVLYTQKHVKLLKRIFSDKKRTVIFFNAKFDIRMLEKAFDFEFKCQIEEVGFAAHMCHSQEMSYKLKDLARKYLSIDNEDEDELKRETAAARRIGKKHGWKLGLRFNHLDANGRKNKAATASDYWMCRAVDPNSRTCQRYAILDAVRTGDLWTMYVEVMDEFQVRHVYEKEMRLWGITYQMETRGPRVIKDAVLKQKRIEEKKCEKELKFIRKEAGKDFNPNSPNQVSEFLYGTLGLECQVYTDKGNPGTNWEALLPHTTNPYVSALMRYRASEKNLGTFIGNYMAMWCDDTLVKQSMCLHPSWQQIGPSTGRYACREPNLMQVSYGVFAKSRGSVPFSARTYFGPRPGYTWFFYDYSQLEARLFAGLANEKFMIQCYEEGRDLHTECCNRAWGGYGNEAAYRQCAFMMNMEARGIYPSPEILSVWKKYNYAGVRDLKELKSGGVLSKRSLMDTRRALTEMLDDFEWDIVSFEASIGQKNSRSRAKTLLFNRIYGGGAAAVANATGCDIDEARQFMEDYSDQFPRIDEFIKEMSVVGRKQGYVLNRFGRRLTIERGFEYRAVNYVTQSFAADLLKRSMRRIDKFFKVKGYDAHILFNIHDELIIEISNKELKGTWERVEDEKGNVSQVTDCWLLRKIARMMENHGGLIDIPIVVDCEMSPETWDTKYGVAFSK